MKKLHLLVLLFLLISMNTIGNGLLAQTPLETAIDYLDTHKATFKLVESDLNDPIVTNNYSSKHNGVTHIYLNQQHKGIKVYNAVSTINVSNTNEVLSVGNRFVSNLATKVNSTQPSLGIVAAIGEASRQLGLIHISEIENLEIIAQENKPNKKTTISKGNVSLQSIEAELVYQLVGSENEEEQARLAWNFILHTIDGQNIWSVRVDAENGNILSKYDRLIKCEFGHPHEQGLKHNEPCSHSMNSNNKSQTSKEPATLLPVAGPNDYLVYPIPVESPNHGERAIVNSPWALAPAASPFGWHDTGEDNYITTRGNNVWAREDRDGNNTGGFSPESEDLDFNYPVDFNQPPSDYQSAAITNLFFWCNTMHDVWYNYGFDEVSGNFQANNRGLGGFDGDYVIADAQDGSGLNNANFSVTDDGQLARVQMFEWTPANGMPPQVETDLGTFNGARGNFGPGLSEIEGDLVLVDDGSNTPTLGCFPLENADEIDGNIALVDRGECFFVEKAEIAQNAGAIAIVVIQNEPGEAPFPMGAPEDYTGGVTIPSIMISYEDGQEILDNLEDGQSVTLLPGSPNIDGDFDQGIIAHEYGHGISSRLTGGSFSADCLSGDEQMGEGWSDWFGLMMTMTEDHTRTTGRGYGTFAFSQGVNGVGIRPARYSTSTSINNATYGDIPGQAVPHGVGFVWATILWEVTWDLIDEYGFDSDLYDGTGGNNLAMQLVIDGLKLQACNPGFVDGRDAILLADRINNDGANQCLLWEAFARRGLGYGASQGSPNSKNDQTESFDLPPSCANLNFEFTAVSEEVDYEGAIEYALKVENKSGAEANNVNISVEIPEEVSFVEGSTECEVESNGTTLTFSLGNLDTDAIVNCSFQLQSNFTEFTKEIFVDDHEGETVFWEADNAQGPFQWKNSDDAFSGENAWQASNAGIASDQWLILKNSLFLSQNNDLVLRFWHKFNTEQKWDGGIVEYSTDDGDTWTGFDKDLFLQNGYTQKLQNGGRTNFAGGAVANNPIKNEDAFSGRVDEYMLSMIDLNELDGENIKIRFRMGTDGLVDLEGWYVDDVQVMDAVFLNTNACMTAAEQDDFCIEHAALVTGFIECAASTQPLSASLETDAGLLDIAIGSPVTVAYEVATAEEGYENAIIVTKDDEDLTIQTIVQSGEEIDLQVYPLADFTVWTVNYATFNPIASFTDFVNQNNFTSASNLIETATAQGICYALDNKDSEGNIMKISVGFQAPTNTGIEDITNLNLKDFQISPIPAQNDLTIEFVSLQNTNLTINIYDVKGKILNQTTWNINTGENRFTLDVSEYAAGTYFFNMTDASGKTASTQFIKN